MSYQLHPDKIVEFNVEYKLPYISKEPRVRVEVKFDVKDLTSIPIIFPKVKTLKLIFESYEHQYDLEPLKHCKNLTRLIIEGDPRPLLNYGLLQGKLKKLKIFDISYDPNNIGPLLKMDRIHEHITNIQTCGDVVMYYIDLNRAAKWVNSVEDIIIQKFKDTYILISIDEGQDQSPQAEKISEKKAKRIIGFKILPKSIDELYGHVPI
jgi:hypothetical protein